MNCAVCGKKTCDDGEMCKEINMDFLEKYDDPEDRAIFVTASKVEAEGYMKLTRLQEIIKFSQDIGYKHLGIAFCIGFEDEAKILYRILKQHFRISSVCCKVCSVSKDDIGIQKIIEDRYEAMCNPIVQAEILGKRKTELNLICGLCIGHDMLFTKHSKAPVTTFIVKDRVLGHNPAAALYSNYYKKLLMQK
ncbi:MAG: DUF1847 domain-containing protein [bacterium]|nr:DUF1847 domain-containing protein [bacterium]